MIRATPLAGSLATATAMASSGDCGVKLNAESEKEETPWQVAEWDGLRLGRPRIDPPEDSE